MVRASPGSKHRRAGTSKTQDYWDWVSGKKDEAYKWFGLHVESARGGTRITTTVETTRLHSPTDGTIRFRGDSPRYQIPGIVSFVGDTGGGKFTLSEQILSHNVKTLMGYWDDHSDDLQLASTELDGSSGQLRIEITERYELETSGISA